MNPKVSIIIPVYNAPKFIRACLVNCINQTLKEIEIIVVDDKSTDNTVELIKQMMQEDSRIKLIELKKNQKQGYARNVGIEQAQADYILFLDVDDSFANDCAEEMYKKIVEDNADMTVCKFATVNDETGEVSYEHWFKNYADLPEKLHKGFSYKDCEPSDLFDKCNVVWDKIYKKSFILENNIKFPGGMYCEDDVFSFKTIFRAKKVTVLNKYLVFYRINRKTSSSNQKDRTTFDCFKMFKMIKEDLLNQGIFSEIQKIYMKYQIHSFIFYYKTVNKKYQKEFFDRMKSELSIYKSYIENKINITFDSVTYEILASILNNNYYTFEMYRFLQRLKDKNFNY